MSRQVPRILHLSEPLAAPGGPRFALLHVVAGERHHVGWFELTDDPWRVGLTDAGAVADAGVDPDAVRAATEALLDELWQWATLPQHAYAHRWRVGDLLLWDNRSTMHRRDPFDAQQRRVMHRTQIRGSVRPRAFEGALAEATT